MAPLSILPGRVRFEDERLIGNKQLSRHLETRIAALSGVHHVSATYRTGRILVEFNEFQITQDDLASCITEALSCEVPPVSATCTAEPTAQVMAAKDTLFSSGDILADMALHLLLPAPFDMLLPALGSSLRRDQPLPCTP